MQNNLDVSHLTCPLALLQVKRWLAAGLPQQKVQLLAPKGQKSQDILRFIDLSEHEIIMQSEQPDGLQIVILINPNVTLDGNGKSDV